MITGVFTRVISVIFAHNTQYTSLACANTTKNTKDNVNASKIIKTATQTQTPYDGDYKNIQKAETKNMVLVFVNKIGSSKKNVFALKFF